MTHEKILLIAKMVPKPDGTAVLYGEPSKRLIHEER